MADYRSRILLEYRQINEEGLKTLDIRIFLHTGALCWVFHDRDTWNAMVLVLPHVEKPIHRDYFTRSKLVNELKGEGLADYVKISALKID